MPLRLLRRQLLRCFFTLIFLCLLTLLHLTTLNQEVSLSEPQHFARWLTSSETAEEEEEHVAEEEEVLSFSSSTTSNSSVSFDNSDVAFAVKTFERPECVFRVVARIRLLYPSAPIFVVDDSGKASSISFPPELRVHYYPLPEDSGVAYGRNFLVQKVYEAGLDMVVIIDDDYLLDATFNLSMMIQVLTEMNADIIGTERCDTQSMPPLISPPGQSIQTLRKGCARRSDASIVPDSAGGRGFFIEPHTSRYDEDYMGCYRTDVVQHSFLARVDSLVRSGWDSALHTNDHYDFFFNARHNKLRTFICPQATVWHVKALCVTHDEQRSYSQSRVVRWPLYLPHVFGKWQLDWLVDERGKNITILDPEGPTIKPTNWTQVATSTPVFSQSLLTSLLPLALNSQLPGYNLLAVQAWKSVRKTSLGPCVQLVSVEANVFLDRPKPTGFASLTSQVVIPQLDLSSCDLATRHNKLVMIEEINQHRHVEFVTAHQDMVPFLHRLVAQVEILSLVEKEIHLTVADFASRDEDLDVVRNAAVGSTVVSLPGNFSRSIGLSSATEAVQRRWKETSLGAAEEDPIIFAIDSSMVFTDNLVSDTRSYVHCGKTAFAPVVMKWVNPPSSEEALEMSVTDQTELGWANGGYGMVAMCLSDYIGAGGYDIRWGTKWGHEDIDLVERLRISGLQIIRFPYNQMTHSVVKTGKQAKSRRGVNIYTKELPVIPTAIFVQDFPQFSQPVLEASLGMDTLLSIQERRSSIETALYWLDASLPKGWFHFLISFPDGTKQAVLSRTSVSATRISVQKVTGLSKKRQAIVKSRDQLPQPTPAKKMLRPPSFQDPFGLSYTRRKKKKGSGLAFYGLKNIPGQA